MAMPRPNLSTADVAAFRAQIVETAMGLLSGGDARALSFRSLGRALGCSHATPYRYFSSKEEVLAAVRAEGFRRFAQFLATRLEGIAEPEARVRALALGYYDFAQTEAAAFAVMFTLKTDDGAVAASLADARVAWDVLVDVIAEATAAGVLNGDVQRTAHVFWAAVHGVTTLQGARKLRMGTGAASLLDDVVESLLARNRKGDALA